MIKCELCGKSEGRIFVNHWEDHVSPPRVLTICCGCHDRIHVGVKSAWKRGNLVFGELGIYNGVMRLPSLIRSWLGDTVKIITTYPGTVVITKSGAPPDLVSESLRYLVDVISKEAKGGKGREAVGCEEAARSRD